MTGVSEDGTKSLQNLFCSWRFERHIDAGNFGDVVVAVRDADAKRCAVKIINSYQLQKFVTQLQSLNQVDDECEIPRYLRHPNITFSLN